MRFTASQSLLIAYLSEAYLLAGRMEEAFTQALRALELSRAHQERGHEAWVHRLLGDLHAHRNPPAVEQAEASYQQALALAEELGMRPLQAHCHCGLGILYTQLGRLEQARAELSVAIELYRAMEMTFWLPARRNCAGAGGGVVRAGYACFLVPWPHAMPIGSGSWARILPGRARIMSSSSLRIFP